MDFKMTPEQMQKIVNEAPEGWEWVVISNQDKVVYFRDCVFGLTYYKGGTCWLSANPAVKKYLVSKECIRTKLSKYDTLDLESSDIPHDTIVLEK